MSLEIFGFADGENLVLRYEDMIKNGAKPKRDAIHIPGLLAWHPQITTLFVGDVSRLSYYQTVVGDDIFLDSAKDSISNTKYLYFSTKNQGKHPDARGFLYPKIYKKSSKNTKSKSVDINITVDALRCVINDTGNVVFILSGDGDYLPLVEEINRHGKQVWVGAFSRGLNKNLRYAADEFFDLDSIFFENH